MVKNIEVERQPNENTTSVIRRFTKRVQGSGILPKARSMRFYERPSSNALKKRRALKAIDRRERYKELAKLGKLPPQKGRRR